MFGMHILALASEAKTAANAVAVIKQLVETRGQGEILGSEHKTYNNAFLICDSDETYHVECYENAVGVKRVAAREYSISNVCTFPEFQQHWGNPGTGAVRAERTLELLRQTDSAVSAIKLFSILRDHKEMVGNAKTASICMHNGDWGKTVMTIPPTY